MACSECGCPVMIAGETQMHYAECLLLAPKYPEQFHQTAARWQAPYTHRLLWVRHDQHLACYPDIREDDDSAVGNSSHSC